MLRHLPVPAFTARALLAALIATAAVTGSPRAARAEVLRLEITRREPYAGGREFGKSGPYEAVSGIVRYAVDPKAPAERAIVDLERAPRRSDGRVEFAADFYLLKPLDPARGNGALFYDVEGSPRSRFPASSTPIPRRSTGIAAVRWCTPTRSASGTRRFRKR